MRKIITTVLLLVTALTNAQNKPFNEADAVLAKVQAALNNIAQVSYTQTRETHYYADNYYNLFKADLYMDFTADGPLHMRFQADETTRAFIYNGHETLRLNKEDLTIDSATVRTAQKMESNSYLYNSLFMVRNMLLSVTGNDSLQRSVNDTTIGSKKYYKIIFEGANIYFQLLGGLERFTAKGLRRPYYLLVDKKTYLPYQLIAKYVRDSDDRDFVTVTYDNINTHAAAPAAKSWQYQAYAAQYKPYEPPVKVPLVKAGTVLANFTLPNYTPNGIDSVSLAQYAGKIVLLDFWFKSCGPCMEAMPHYNELQNRYAKDGFQLLTVNVEDPVEDVKFFYNKHRPVYKMMYNGNKLWKGLGFTGCPSSVLIDQKGKVVQTFYGFDKEVIGKKVEELVKAL